MSKPLILLVALASLCSCLFSPTSAVVKLTQKNFESLVLSSDEVWLVQFYAPWCGHCKHSAPEFEKAAEILKGVVNVGAVDMTTDGKAGERYKVQGFPTIKFFGRDKETPYDYSSGDRTYEKFVNYSLAKVKGEISSRIKQIQEKVQETVPEEKVEEATEL